jgi:hypothetical protein
MESVKIDRLEVRLKGISPEVARSAAASLGTEVLGQLSKRSGPLRNEPATTISRIDLGTLETERDTGSSDLRRTIAARVVKSITS